MHNKNRKRVWLQCGLAYKSCQIVTAVFLLFLADGVTAQQETKWDHWHQWRGPDASGTARNAKPALHWSESKNISWKVPIDGEGISTPIVWKNRIYLTTAIQTDRIPETPQSKDARALTTPPEFIFEFKVICLNLETGDVEWEDICTEQMPHEGRHPSSTYAAASAMTDGKRLVVPFGSFGIFCYSLNGDRQWSVDLGDMHTRRGWGEATSPVLVDDRVIMTWDNEDESFIYALNADTGETVWKVARDEPTTWATPLIVKRDGKPQVVTNGTNQVVSYDLASGKTLWSTKGTTLNAIPCPVEFGDNVICMSGYRGNRAVSINVGSRGEITQNWEIKKGTPYVPSPALSNNRLFFTQSNRAILNCVNAKTGTPFFGPQRLPGLENLYGSPIVADGRVYLTSREGVTLVFRDAEQFEVLATNTLDDQFDASPVAVDDRLLLRGRKSLYCIQKSDE